MKVEMICDLDGVRGDVANYKAQKDGTVLITSREGDKFIFVRDASPHPVKATIDRPLSFGHPALRVEVAGQANIARGTVVVGPVTVEQNQVATGLLAEAEVLREAARGMGGSDRLERAAARKIEQAKNLGGGAAAQVTADRETIKMAGGSIDGAPVAVALAKGQSSHGRQAGTETTALSDRNAVDAYVKNSAYTEALADQRTQPNPGFLERLAARVNYVVKGGKEPEMARVGKLHKRFEQVRVQAGRRIKKGLENARRTVLSVPTNDDLQAARGELGGQIEEARQEARQEATRISDWVTADTGHYGNNGSSGGGGIGGFLSELVHGDWGVHESVIYSKEGMRTAERFGPK